MLEFYAANSLEATIPSESNYLGSLDREDIAILNNFKIVNSNADNALSHSQQQFFDLSNVNSRLELAICEYDAVQNSTCIKSQSAEKYIEIFSSAATNKTGIKVLVVP